jgi:hypothetical protein
MIIAEQRRRASRKHSETDRKSTAIACLFVLPFTLT